MHHFRPECTAVWWSLVQNMRTTFFDRRSSGEGNFGDTLLWMMANFKTQLSLFTNCHIQELPASGLD